MGLRLSDQGGGIARMQGTVELIGMWDLVVHGFRLPRIAAVERGRWRDGTVKPQATTCGRNLRSKRHIKARIALASPDWGSDQTPFHKAIERMVLPVPCEFRAGPEGIHLNVF
ncbi:hypothetical protein GCM10007928_24100 [Sulfitobacter porphyrae]|nr:hypothetical protein GCM10007928_24100 [Sulfitobacter porphyrae]